MKSEGVSTETTIDRLVAEARKIVAMAEDLRDRGLRAEAFTFLLAAAERLRAARVLQDLRDVNIT